MEHRKCKECGRVFDLTNEDDSAEWHYGHDCEMDTPVIFEARCSTCPTWILTDEHIGGWPYFGSCSECGGQAVDEWRVSDEPHPALWEYATSTVTHEED